ncbi:MAG: undecaprenyl-diphosphate phosphatase [Clostridia bacterium]|nr:undecaprenyl-diphosphate phosphatase [Clostridia bacterium]
MIIDILVAVVLGVVEGITEWLPISSTGHLILVEKLLSFSDVSDGFKEMFDVVIQLGAVLAVVVIYWNRLWPFCKDKSTHYIKKGAVPLWCKVIIGVLPAAVIGLLFDDKIDALFYDNPFVIAATLIIYGVLFIVLERFNKKRTFKINSIEDMSYLTAFFIGCFQVLSMIPGTSRSGITILGAMLLCTSRTVAADYSFFMSFPVMLGASALKLIKYVTSAQVPLAEWVILAVGMVVAFLISVVAIKFLISYIKKKDFTVFGYYRIILGIIVLLYFGLIQK